MNIYEKLSAVRDEFHSFSIVKTGYNKHSKYSYFELSDFLVPALKITSEHGLVPVISFTPELATMTVYDTESEATIVITSPMSEASLPACQPVQSLGGVETYQRRYLWVTLLEIVEHDVIEETATESPDKAPPEMATDEQMVVIEDYKDAGQIAEVTLAWMVKHPNLTEAQAATLIKKLRA